MEHNGNLLRHERLIRWEALTALIFTGLSAGWATGDMAVGFHDDPVRSQGLNANK